jgi:hypothetical protein
MASRFWPQFIDLLGGTSFDCPVQFSLGGKQCGPSVGRCDATTILSYRSLHKNNCMLEFKGSKLGRTECVLLMYVLGAGKIKVSTSDEINKSLSETLFGFQVSSCHVMSRTPRPYSWLVLSLG